MSAFSCVGSPADPNLKLTDHRCNFAVFEATYPTKQHLTCWRHCQRERQYALWITHRLQFVQPGHVSQQHRVVDANFLDEALHGLATINGDATGQVRLNLPLATLERSRVQGSVTLAGNDLRMTPDTPQLTRARGLVTFSDSGFQITGGQARMLGGELRLEGGTRGATPGTAGTNTVTVVLTTATIYITLNLIADIAYILVNPRLRG